MILNLSLLIGMAIVWLGLLGFVIPFNAGALSAPSLFSLLILPPLLFALGIVLWRRWKEKREAAQQQAAADAQSAEQTERLAKARQTHEAELQERRHHADCRAVWVEVVAEAMPPWCDAAPPQTLWLARDANVDEFDRIAAVTASVSDTLRNAFADSPALAYLPLYVLPGHEQDGRMLLEQTKASWDEALADGELSSPPGANCKFLPGSGAINDRVIALLRNDPTLPGFLVLACDSPLALQADEDEFDLPDPQQLETQRWHGKAGQAVVLQLFTRPDLHSVASSEPASDQGDPYQPYWERNHSQNDESVGWGRVPPQWQESLVALAPIARIYQSRELYKEEGLPKGNKLSQLLRGTVEAALINAGLRDLPFDPADAGEDQSHELAWLAHNCGGVDVGGQRLAAVSSVLSYFESELNPISDACNLVTEFGDTGGARSAMLNAIAISQAAQLQKPVLITEFSAHNQLIASVVRHATPEESNA